MSKQLRAAGEHFSTAWEFYCDTCGERLEGVSYEAAKRAYDTHEFLYEDHEDEPHCFDCRERAIDGLPIPCLACALDGRREEYEDMEKDRRAGA